ncbi:MAG: 50S ribosomal protein L25 [Candidatus Riesia sp.]|nr:50S ribosomal protein L25 [Candidatus Riesia sp.]
MNSSYSFSLRLKSGKNYNAFLRLNGNVPAVIYGDAFNKAVCLDRMEAFKMIKSFESGVCLFNCRLDGDEFLVVLKSIMKHPLNSSILHIDFQKVNLDSYVKLNIPFNFIGHKKSPGILSGGYLVKHMSYVTVKCKVSDIPKYILVDLSSLVVNTSVFLKDISFPEFLIVPLLQKKNKSNLLVVSVVGSRVTLPVTNDK